MNTIAFEGGSSLCEIGTSADVLAFFSCVDRFFVARHPSVDASLIVDRLFRRYLNLDELSPAVKLMAEIKAIFEAVPAESVDFVNLGVGKKYSKLDLAQRNLGCVFGHVFKQFFHCAESSRLNFDAFCKTPGYELEPVRIVIADQPWFSVEKQRRLDEYDSLTGAPFWLVGRVD